MFKTLDTYRQISLKENMKADKSPRFLTLVKIVGHTIEGTTITPLKSRIDAVLKLQPPSDKNNYKSSFDC